MYLFNCDATPSEVESTVSQVSERLYGGNVTVKSISWAGRRIMFTLRVNDSSGPGAKRGSNGRKTVAACWHAHRDVMIALFDKWPDAHLLTVLARYRGKAEFEELFYSTGDRQFRQCDPENFRTMCRCDENVPERVEHEFRRANP